jgi:hypothetical protein
VIVLALGDASIEVNGNESARLKIQQGFQNVALLEATREVLRPWCVRITRVSKKRPNMWEITTLSHTAFYKARSILAGSNDMSYENDRTYTIQKGMPTNIIDYLDPITIAAWFCGDGGRRDYGVNQGKAVQFHTQGFSRECCDRLAEALRERYGWDITVVPDKRGRPYHLLQVEASSFDSFEATMKPFILPEFFRRLPTSRALGSRFKRDIISVSDSWDSEISDQES